VADIVVGTNSPNYTPVPGDVGANIYCRVTAVNASGSASANSNTVGLVGPAEFPPANAGGPYSPAISGTAEVDETLTVDNPGIWTGSLPITYTYQWKTVDVVDSPVSVDPPIIGGSIADDAVLTVTDNGTWSGEAPMTYTYQWYSVIVDDVGSPLLDDAGRAYGALIPGARSSTYIIGGIPVPPESTWNEVDRLPDFILSNGNLTAECSLVKHGCARGTRAHSSGKRYFEITADRVNLGSYLFFGFCDDTHGLAIAMYPGNGSDLTGATVYIHSFSGGGTVLANGGTAGGSSTNFTWADGDVCGFALDFALRRFWVHRNGVWYVDYAGAPGVGSGMDWGTVAGPLKPYAELDFNGGVAGKCTLNTGATAFAYPLPSGFLAWEAP
jgi:hypothetical protein